MQVALWPIGKITPYPGNPRLNDDAFAAVAASIREFGFRQPIVVDADGVMICGHTRWKAAQHLGLGKVPAHVAKDLTSEQIKPYGTADKRRPSWPSGTTICCQLSWAREWPEGTANLYKLDASIRWRRCAHFFAGFDRGAIAQ
jgi:hypothetical protein